MACASALEAKSAIFPINVSAPILITTPPPLPSLQFVEKNARFLASNALSFPLSPHSFEALIAILSPVKGALSNCKSPSIIKILISAGTFSPVFIFITSPLTTSTAGICCCCPSLVTVTTAVLNDLKLSIISPLF